MFFHISNKYTEEEKERIREARRQINAKLQEKQEMLSRCDELFNEVKKLKQMIEELK